jgi:hypothetical protein
MNCFERRSRAEPRAIGDARRGETWNGHFNIGGLGSRRIALPILAASARRSPH